MNKRLVLKLIEDIIKQYAYVKDFKREILKVVRGNNDDK